MSLGFLNPDNTPTDKAKNVLPSNLSPPPAEVIGKIVVLFHDETFQANEDQPTLWTEKGTSVMRPKSRGCGIMVLDFISENHGYFQLMKEEYDEVKQSNPRLCKHAHETLEYGDWKEGYWTSERLMTQIRETTRITDVKYPREEGWGVCRFLTRAAVMQQCPRMD